MRLFGLHSTREFSEKVATSLGISLDPHEERNFEDGEHKIRPLVSVRNQDVYVIQSLYQDEEQTVNDKLCKLLFFIATLNDAGAQRVTAVTPYLCYARKDRRTKARDPVTLRYVASLFEAVNVARVVTLDVHNLQAYQNGFRCPAEHLEARNLFADQLINEFQNNNLIVMSPDNGGIKRAERFRALLTKRMNRDVGFAFMEKQRSEDVVTGDKIIGEIADKVVVILDDLISSGTTMTRAAKVCKALGATQVFAMATHAAFTGKANEVFREKTLNGIMVTNTIPPFRLSAEVAKEKLTVLDAAPLFAEVIRRLHTGGSIVELMNLE